MIFFSINVNSFSDKGIKREKNYGRLLGDNFFMQGGDEIGCECVPTWVWMCAYLTGSLPLSMSH